MDGGCFLDKKWFALWTGLLYGQKVVCFMDGVALWTKSDLLYGRIALWTKSGMLYGQQFECPSQKIGHCQNSVALWTGLLYGQKAVCFMDEIALWTKSGMLYDGIVLLTKGGDAL